MMDYWGGIEMSSGDYEPYGFLQKLLTPLVQ